MNNNMSHKELVEMVRGEISHNISPVIGWLRHDAAVGRVDTDQKRAKAFYERVDIAAESIASIIEGIQND